MPDTRCRMPVPSPQIPVPKGLLPKSGRADFEFFHTNPSIRQPGLAGDEDEVMMLLLRPGRRRFVGRAAIWATRPKVPASA